MVGFPRGSAGVLQPEPASAPAMAIMNTAVEFTSIAGHRPRGVAAANARTARGTLGGQHVAQPHAPSADWHRLRDGDGTAVERRNRHTAERGHESGSHGCGLSRRVGLRPGRLGAGLAASERRDGDRDDRHAGSDAHRRDATAQRDSPWKGRRLLRRAAVDPRRMAHARAGRGGASGAFPAVGYRAARLA